MPDAPSGTNRGLLAGPCLTLRARSSSWGPALAALILWLVTDAGATCRSFTVTLGSTSSA